MALPRPALAAVLSAIAIVLSGAPAPALGARAHARAHHAARCHTRRSRSASYRRSHRARCRGRHRHGAHPGSGSARHAGSGSSRHGSRHAVPRTLVADSNGNCTDATMNPTPEDIELVRAATLCLINRERTSRGEQPLRWDGALVAAAQGHTESMAFGDYFEHNGPGGDTPASRMRQAGYIPNGNVGYEIGENIGWGTLWLGSPRAIVAAWMASPAHRANILDARYRDTGIGVSPHPPASLAGGQSGGIYTQDFGVITYG